MAEIFRIKLLGDSGWTGRPEGYPSWKAVKMAALGAATRAGRVAEVKVSTDGERTWRHVHATQPGRTPEAKRRDGAPLPQLFQGLTERDWRQVRAVSGSQSPGEEEAVSTSIGYLDVGKEHSGRAYVGGMSFDANGGGGLQYRSVFASSWR